MPGDATFLFKRFSRKGAMLAKLIQNNPLRALRLCVNIHFCWLYLVVSDDRRRWLRGVQRGSVQIQVDFILAAVAIIPTIATIDRFT